MPGTAADLDTRSDIFALGVMLWELMCGRRPFQDEDVSSESLAALEAMLDSRSRDVDPEFLDQLPADCPPSLRRVLLTCLAPKRRTGGRPAPNWPSSSTCA